MLSGLRVSALNLCAAILICGCEKPIATFDPGEPCDTGKVVVVDGFDGARRGACEVYADGSIEVHIRPEDAGPINDSPWYAFRLLPDEKTDVKVTLDYHGGKHRYWPKVSSDGIHWTRLDESAVDIGFLRSSAEFSIVLNEDPVWVAAQEIVLPTDMQAWVQEQSAHPQVTQTVLGESTNGLPIPRLDINTESDDVVFLVGRQHPPEVSGVFGMQGFYEAIVADTELASRFRDRFHIVAIPMLNPDGVIAGNWRHNNSGVDLNRDWGPFTQAETKLVEALLNRFDDMGKRVMIFVDFHSTKSNLMYTQTDEDITDPPRFTDRWIAAALPSIENYEFSQEPRPFSDLATGRNYMYGRYGVPSVTFEVADEEDRAVAIEAAGVFAEKMMHLLIDDRPNQGAHN